MVDRKQFNKVRQLSVPIKPMKCDIDIYTVNFPERLKNLIINKKVEAYDDKNEPDKNLKTILYHNISDISYIDTISYNMDCNKWICSEEPIDIDLVGTFLRSWYSITYGIEESIDDSIKEIKCKKTRLAFDFGSKEANGTVKLSADAYTIFLSLLAKKISRELKITIGSRICEFFMVTPIYNNSVELIARPSQFVKLEDTKTLWTYKITLKIQTTYKQDNAVLCINPSMIRLCYNEINVRYKYKNATAFIFIDRDKYSGNGNPHYISTNLIKNGNTLKWNKVFEDLLKGIRLHKLLPKASEIQSAPLNFIDNKEGFPVMVGFGSHLKGKHCVKAGLSMKDRYMLETEIEKLIKKEFDFFSDEINILDRVQLPSKESNDITYDLEHTDFDEEMLRELKELSEEFQEKELISKESTIKLIQSRKYFKGKVTIPLKRFIEKFPELLKINLFYRDKAWMELTKSTLIFNYFLSLKSGNKYFPLNFPDKTVIINEINTSQWSFIDEAETKSEIISSILDLVDEREEFELALFELPDDKAYWNKLDPKLYIRQALGKLKMLTQFITPLKDQSEIDELSEVATAKEYSGMEELKYLVEASEIIYRYKDDKDRFKKASLDALRQYGIYRNTVDNILKENEKTAYVGLYIHKEGRSTGIPIMVSIGHENDVMLSFNGGKWYDYREGLAKLANVKPQKEPIKTSQIYDPLVLLKERYGMEHIVLFADAYKLRTILPGFQNGKMDCDINLVVGKDYGNVELKESYKMVNEIISFARIREEGSGEVSDWVAYDEVDYATSMPGGLFKLDEYNYYSIANKPGTAAKINTELKESKPGKMFRKETAVEICIPKVKDGVKSDEIAVMAHKLRDKVVLQFDEFISYPFPLHLAELTVEYLK